MTPKETLEFLRNHSVFWSKLGFCYDPPRMNEKGKPIVFFDNWDEVKKYHSDFYKAGIKLHTSILFNGWVGVDKFDYELTDRVLDTVFSCGGEDLLYIPRIKLNVPMEWSRENPEELCVYENGPRDREGIAALVGTLQHDFLGYSSPKGYYTAGGWQDDRPNVNGLISNQSFSSRKWLADAGKVLRKLIRHIEDGPYGKRIPAYHIAYGVSGESCVWGRCNVKNTADFGITNRKMFFDWGMKKYGSLSRLRQAWCQPELTGENVQLPGLLHKENGVRNLPEFFRAAPEDLICSDYELFTADCNVDAMEHFGKIVKEETAGKCVGVFYGYFLMVARSNYTGYNAMERVLNSPYIDFIAAPKREGGGEMCPAQGVNLGKLWMDELDNRTNIARNTGIEYKSVSYDETKSIMWREFAKNISHNSSFWWMDLGGGWYDDPELLREIGRIEKAARLLRGRSTRPVSEICVLVDESAFYKHKTSYYLHKCLFPSMIDAMNRTGAIWDLYHLRDFEKLDLSNYKLILFANPFCLQEKLWKKLDKKLPKNATLIWNYAPGICGENGYNLDFLREFTQCEVQEILADFLPQTPCGEFAGMEPIFWPNHIADDSCPIAEEVPMLELSGKNCKPLAKNASNGITICEFERSGRRNIFAAAPILTSSCYRKLLESASGSLPAPENVLLYGDSRFLAFFAWKESQFTCKLPPGKWFEAVKEEMVEKNQFSLTLKENEARVYILKDGKDFL